MIISDSNAKPGILRESALVDTIDFSASLVKCFIDPGKVQEKADFSWI